MSSVIRVEFINPFITAVNKTFETMLGFSLRRSAPVLKQNPHALFPVTGIIGLSGSIAGTVILTLSESVAVKAASVMLMEELTAINADVLDAVGELTNMIAGNAKAQLEEYKLSLSLPNVISGEGTEVRFPETSQPITIPFESDFGSLAIEIGFSERRTS